MSKSLKILRIADILNNRTGGMSRVMHFSSDVMREQGHTVDLLFTIYNLSKCPLSLRRFFVPLYIARYVRDSVRRGDKYDVVEVHEPHGAALCQLRKSRRSQIPPVVGMTYGIEERMRSARIKYSLKKGKPLSPKEKYSALSVVWQAQYVLKNADHVLLANTEDLQYLTQEKQLDATRFSIYKTGVSQEWLNSGESFLRQPANPARFKKILFFGSWLERKGIADFVPAVTAVLQNYPDVTVTIAGTGCAEDVVRQAFPSDKQKGLIVIPKVTESGAAQCLFQENAIFVLPSYFEGQPLVMIEAASQGAVIIATDTCGMRDFVVPQQNGDLVPIGEPTVLQSSIESVLKDAESAGKMGYAAHETARQQSWDVTAAAMIDAYKKVL